MALAPAPTRLRQIALVAEDIERAKQQLTYVLGTEVVFKDPAVEQWGLKNFLIPIGGDFIEVVSPIKPGTTAGRLIEKRGDGGYMIIMQTEDAKKRREYIEAKGLSRVIFEHSYADSVCIQYHPRGIKGMLDTYQLQGYTANGVTGGMMPELDSHVPGPKNPTPVQSRFSPWHACGLDIDRYRAGMERTEHLTLEGCVLRLQPGDLGHEAAAREWEAIFGVVRSRDLLAFTNARLGFIPGRQGHPEGLVSITIGVKGQDKYDAILERARQAGVCGNDGIDMCGVKWYLALTGHSPTKGKL
ncbi:uncharacterized protein J4E88_009954 [Alternaria novae-zelandiae]|uniref:uncharacterized protein n=1 Tax=Alternaria novae-zelandiae TaxID=430562 RepID=UPI0020C50E7C|nr:uncharacterized protein J4E88_009954 [Alternaria novae-zelandiae]KAI4669672.1 hypothetical protein J4E88_009954 [Alternaria novae-zelandiae]